MNIRVNINQKGKKNKNNDIHIYNGYVSCLRRGSLRIKKKPAHMMVTTNKSHSFHTYKR